MYILPFAISCPKSTRSQSSRGTARGKYVISSNKMCTSPLVYLAGLSVSALRMAEEKSEAAAPAISPSDCGELPYEDPEIFRREDRDEEEQGGQKEEKDTEGGGKGEEEEAGEAEAEVFRPSKRMKNCPAALEKSLSSNRGFSFSFDTRVAANGPIESTPKFGSFNHSDGIELGREVEGSRDEEGKKKFREEGREEVEVEVSVTEEKGV